MIKTPEEAKEIRCSRASSALMAGMLAASSLSQTAIDAAVKEAVCKSLNCMSWRWTDEEETEGYCGEAGHPHNQSLHVNADIRGDVNNHY